MIKLFTVKFPQACCYFPSFSGPNIFLITTFLKPISLHSSVNRVSYPFKTDKIIVLLILIFMPVGSKVEGNLSAHIKSCKFKHTVMVVPKHCGIVRVVNEEKSAKPQSENKGIEKFKK